MKAEEEERPVAASPFAQDALLLFNVTLPSAEVLKGAELRLFHSFLFGEASDQDLKNVDEKSAFSDLDGRSNSDNHPHSDDNAIKILKGASDVLSRDSISRSSLNYLN